jgi:predicted enzyme related to lactoylglutathione lyase
VVATQEASPGLPARAKIGDVERLRVLDALAVVLLDAMTSGRQTAESLFAGWVQLGDGFNVCRKWQRALDCYQRALAIRWDEQVAMKMVRLHDFMRRGDEGRALLGALSSGDPGVQHFSALYHYRQGDDALAAELAERVVAAGGAADALRAAATFLLGHIHDRAGRFDAAFDAFTRANQIREATAAAERPGLRQLAYDYLANVEAKARWFTPDRIAALNDRVQAMAPAPPVGFIVGFPRSGTTLLDQVLDSHPALSVSEESDAMSYVLADWDRDDAGRAAMLELADAEVVKLQHAYRARLAALLGGAAYPIDKLPLNITMLDVIRRFVPHAKVVVMVRDPRDSVLSNFMQNYSLNRGMYHFLDFSRAVRFYAAVMGLYRATWTRLGLDILEISYEELIVNLEGVTRRVCTFLEVPWDATMLDYRAHASRREITTPSYPQVTQPIYHSAVGRWRNYESFLSPVLPMLQPFVDGFGYGGSPARQGSST